MYVELQEIEKCQSFVTTDKESFYEWGERKDLGHHLQSPEVT